jgi:phytoene dehydrogenase-like protein
VRCGAGRAAGVELADGTVLEARRAVLAACPPQLVPDLAGDALDLAVAARLRRAPGNAAGVGCLTVNVALSGRLELPAHARDDVDLRRPTLFSGTLEEVVEANLRCERGQVPERTTFCLAILSAIDGSQAPEGQDVAQLYAPAPVRSPENPSLGPERLFGAVSAFAPSLPGLDIGRFVESPTDLEARTGARSGCIYHVDHLPTRMGPLRPALGAAGYRTPLPGLYLGSAGCHPGGGVSGLPGKLSAAAVLADQRSSKGARWSTTSSSSAAATTASSLDACSPVPV